MKAVLISTGVHPPKSHDIEALIELFDPSHPLLSILSPLDRFTPFAWAFRYPSMDPIAMGPSEPSVEEAAAWLDEIVSAIRTVERHLGIDRSQR